MGTYYTIGVIKDMHANANRALTQVECKEPLFDRIDLDCFQLEYDEEELAGCVISDITGWFLFLVTGKQAY